MTVREKADQVINGWKSLYKSVTEEYISDITIENYKTKQQECIDMKAGLDKVDIQIDYTDVDNIYKLVYLQEYKEKAGKYNEQLKELRMEALTKKDVLNKPINDKWDADYKYYKRLKNMQDSLSIYSNILGIYANITKLKIIPVDEINLNHVANKLNDYNKLLARFKLINDILNKNVLVLNLSVIGLLLSLATFIGTIVLTLITVFILGLFISTLIILKNNDDLVSFAIQDIIAPSKEDYKEITFENSPEEFLEFEQKQQLIMDKINDPELKKIFEQANGAGKELYEEQYKEFIDEYQQEYYSQVELQSKWQINLDDFKEKYKDSIKYLGDKFSTSYKLDYNLQLGMDEETGEPFTVNIKDKIIVISDLDTEKKEDILRLILLAIFSNVRYTNIQMNVYDQAWKLTPYQPIDFTVQAGKPFATMCNQYNEFKQYCDDMNNKATVAMSITRKLISVDDYNANADKDINANIQYNICISAVSQSENSSESNDKSFINMLKYTIPFGFIHIILCEDPERLQLPYEKIIIGD